MWPRSAKRKRDDLEKTFFDNSSELSESGTSGSSFHPSDSDNDSDSSTDTVNLVNIASSKSDGKSGNCERRDLPAQKVGKKKINLKKGATQKKIAQTFDSNANSLSSKKEITKICNVASKSQKNKRINWKTSLQNESQQFTECKSGVNGNNPKNKRGKFPLHDKKVIEEACKRLKEGASPKTVAEELGVPENSVRTWRFRHISEDEREELRQHRLSSLNDHEKLLEARRLMKEGATTAFLAKRYGVAEVTIVAWRHRFEPETVKGKGAYPENTVLEACEQLTKGISAIKIASGMGIDYVTINKWRNKYLLKKTRETTSEGSWEFTGYTKLKACIQLKREVAAETISRELDVHTSVLRKWESENVLKIISQPVDEGKYDKKFILNVLEGLQQGESGCSVARKFRVSKGQVYIWKKKYCTNEQPKPSNELNYNKATIDRACELLKAGERVRNVARALQVPGQKISEWKNKYLREASKRPEYHSLSTVFKLVRDLSYYKRKNILQTYKLLKQGESTGAIARRLGQDIALVHIWRCDYMLKGQAKDYSDYSKDIVGQVRKRLQQGDSVQRISRDLRIHQRTVNYWHCDYLQEVGAKFFKTKGNVVGDSEDPKLLKSWPVVVLEKDHKIDQLCKIQNIIPYRKFIDRTTIKQACKRLREGASIETVAKGYGVREERVRLWQRNFIPSDDQLEKSILLARNTRDVNAIIQACRLLKRGESARSVSTKMGIGRATVEKWHWKYLLTTVQDASSEGNWEYSRYAKLEVYRQIKRGVSAAAIAKEFNVDINLVRRWQADCANNRSQLETVKFDEKLRSQVRERLNRGDKVRKISRDLDVPNRKVYEYWRYYLKNSPLESMKQRRHLESCVNKLKSSLKDDLNQQNISSVNRNSEGRKSAKVFVPLRKVHIPSWMKLKFVKMIDEGAPVGKLSRELNVNRLIINSWMLNKNLLMRSNARTRGNLCNKN